MTTRRYTLDVRIGAVAAAAAIAAQSLLFMAGWIGGYYGTASVQRRPARTATTMTVQPAAAVVVIPTLRLNLPATPIPEPTDVRTLIRQAASRHSVPVALIEAIVRVESDFDTHCLSSKGARGLMQVMPETGARFGVANPEQLFHPAHNIAAGTAYLAWLLDRYDGDLDLTLAAYNAGEGAVKNYGGIPPYRETREYVRRVRRVLSRTAV